MARTARPRLRPYGSVSVPLKVSCVVCLVSRSRAFVGAAAFRAVEDPCPELDGERRLHVEGFASRGRLESVAGETHRPDDLEQQRAGISYERNRLVPSEQAAVRPLDRRGEARQISEGGRISEPPPPCPFRTRSGDMVSRLRFRRTP